MSLYPIKADAEFSGSWHLPRLNGEPSVNLAGLLKWSDRQAVLSLHGTFMPTIGAVFGSCELKRVPVVHGSTTASVPVTLLNSAEAGSHMSFGPLGMQEAARIHSFTCVVGALVDVDTTYEKIQARVPGLEHWLDMPIVSTKWTTPADGEPEQVIYTATKVPCNEVLIEKHAMTLRLGVSFTAALGAPMHVDVNGYGYIEIEPDQPQSMGWMLERLDETLALLSFLSGSTMAPGTIQAKLSSQRDPVSWLLRLNNHELCSVSQRSDFFMTRVGMEMPLSEAMTCWFDNYDKIATPSQLALSVINSTGLWPHVEFLSCMQALEGLHRTDSNGLYTGIEEYKAIETALVKAIPATTGTAHRSSLKSRIRYGNEISLRKRLQELVAPVDIEIRQRIFGVEGKFPSIWVEARNYYTHWDEVSEGKNLTPQAMYQANVRMRMLLRVLYLLRVGVPASAVIRSLNNCCAESQSVSGIAAAEHRQANPESQAGVLMTVKKLLATKCDSATEASVSADRGSS